MVAGWLTWCRKRAGAAGITVQQRAAVRSHSRFQEGGEAGGWTELGVAGRIVCTVPLHQRCFGGSIGDMHGGCFLIGKLTDYPYFRRKKTASLNSDLHVVVQLDAMYV